MSKRWRNLAEAESNESKVICQLRLMRKNRKWMEKACHFCPNKHALCDTSMAQRQPHHRARPLRPCGRDLRTLYPNTKWMMVPIGKMMKHVPESSPRFSLCTSHRAETCRNNRNSVLASANSSVLCGKSPVASGASISIVAHPCSVRP